ncbi:hypothetical protein [Sphingobacterium sp.]|uniref:hypothetical protein n=1 Tax=Sphingobacterium sp. TaxID=341027 RepID=UPI00289E565D|nr:hypothetical protein [Sphingobacterium sp.]
MTKEHFITDHPSLTVDQIVKLEEATSTFIPENISGLSACPYLVWVRDEGNIAIMRATHAVTVRVDHVREGKWKGAVFVAMNPNDAF